MARLIRTLNVGTIGDDVYAAKRCVHRYLGNRQLTELEKQPLSVRRTFGIFFRTHVKNAQRRLRIDETGIFTNSMLRRLRDADAVDAYAEHLLDRYQIAHAKPLVELVSPKQGFSSLHRSLWELYAIGRHSGLTDLGTFNPASRLPSGRPSDHAVYPAVAFDLGFTPATGWDHQTARAYFRKCCDRPEVEYVILGDRIFSRAQGVHPYYAGNHDNHVHVSGHR